MHRLDIIVAAILSVLIAGASVIMYQRLTAEKLELIKTEWKCTSSRVELTTQTLPMGKYLTTQVIPHTVCTEYKKIE